MGCKGLQEKEVGRRERERRRKKKKGKEGVKSPKEAGTNETELQCHHICAKMN